MRQTSPRRMPTRYLEVSGRADMYYTLLKGDLEVVAAKGNLIIPRRNSATGCSFMSYPGRIIIIIIIIIIYMRSFKKKKKIIIIIIIIIFNNTLPTRKNLCKWSISQSSACSFCLQSETLQHVVSSCNCYLKNGRYTWRHNSVLLFLANTFSSLNQISVYADLPSFMSPSLITGDSLRPDLLLLTGKKVLYILELTLGFETNIQANSVRKANKYTPLLQDLSSSYNKVIFINVSMGALGVMGASCDSFLSLLQDLSFEKVTQRRIIMKTINIAIRSTYYIFCKRNKSWNNPELLNF